MGEQLSVKSKDHRYSIWIGDNLRFQTAEYVQKAVPDMSTCMIVADEHVSSLYLEDVLSSFNTRPAVTVIPSGEQSKSMDQLHILLTKSLEAGLDRKSVIIALGGGVTGDLAGFAAACYMRGIRFIQMPTTLLAHDSSVGGKTGINHPLGKNLIGAFHAPHGVIYDADMMKTLPEKEWRSGFAEVVKHGLIEKNTGFLQWLKSEAPSLKKMEGEILHELLRRSIQVKVDIVEEDEFERGKRAYLNLGHTLGHAIEAEAGYGIITHGEAVAIGIIFALKLSEKHFQIKLPVKETAAYFEKNGYSLAVPDGLKADRLLEKMKRDKKAQGGKLNFVLLKNVGEPSLEEVDESIVHNLLVEEGK
ncbi:3-dehydroquinate synthase [Alkalicoccus daliensis]|uniref:3-dehydroquinate synthase n=1 Tax=Alkalicoccus daliensis TaxID=745820 RepID=A0A1H0AVB2_9BACI|nr:3-dehydroquinate synthase [Alkalicoccus daliensis]SDN37319.1 3-dehydroquinate synthase [Alkalicoccus daliensis]